jgi:hypothetical protein
MIHTRPCAENHFLADHVAVMRRSFRHWTGQELFDPQLNDADAARAAFLADFILVSHNTASDPVFNYGNNAALALFEFSWEEFLKLPSRFSAESVSREERARALQQVTEHGYIEDYRGVRVSRSGRRFLINKAIVWNLIDPIGRPLGQAAMFDEWTFLPVAPTTNPT